MFKTKSIKPQASLLKLTKNELPDRTTESDGKFRHNPQHNLTKKAT